MKWDTTPTTDLRQFYKTWGKYVLKANQFIEKVVI